MGFSTVWQPLTTGVPCVLTRAVYYCVWGLNNLSMGLLSRAAFSLTRITVCLPVYPLRGSLKFISCPSTYTPRTNHDQIPSPNKINYSCVLFLGSPLFIYLRIHRLLLVACCQLRQQHNGYFVSTPFISSTHHCLSLLVAFNTLFLSRFSLFSLSVETIHL